MDHVKFGAFVAQLRKEQNMTQRELADALQVTDKAVSKWETGKGFPDVQLLEPLSQVLGVSLVELIKGQKLERENLTMDEAGTVISQAMDQSYKVTARKYLRLFFVLLTCVGVACLLRVLPAAAILWGCLRLHLENHLYTDMIGGADGPTAVLIAREPTWWDFWGTSAAAAVILILCAVLAIRVWRLERKLK